jgi:hypothetical protein
MVAARMRASLDPFSFLVISFAGWMNQRQQQVIHYLVEENRFCESKLVVVDCVLAITQRRRLAVTAVRECRLEIERDSLDPSCTLPIVSAHPGLARELARVR